MKPVIALVGRPNVGKSTLFNRLTRTREALVADQPGLTRDRKYGVASLEEHSVILVDTGGLSGDIDGIDGLMASQTIAAVNEADLVLFLVDARDGLVAEDDNIARRLRQLGKKVILLLNKIDGINSDVVLNEFYELALGEPVAISSAHGKGIGQLREVLLENLPDVTPDEEEEDDEGRIKIAIVGRPNVGKSTLVNRMLGEDRVVVYDMPGTTRDSIKIPYERDGVEYTLIDTAGVRRRGKVSEVVEKFSVIKTLQSITEAHVVIMMLDASQEIAEQDMSLLGYVIDAGRALVVAVNKWDGLDIDQRDFIKKEIDRKLPFIGFADLHFISALHGTGVGHLYDSVNVAYKSATRKLSTPELTRILEDALESHQPPLVRGRRIKLRYAHQGGRNPPVIIIHGNQTASIPASYKRYLINTFHKVLKLRGTPLKVEFKTGDNPYKDRRNTLTPRQERSRKRLKKHIKKSGK
jgi:GTP-binding protein